MVTRSSGGGGFEDSEAALGGADALPDTPDVAGHGTEPEQRPDGAVRAIVGPGRNQAIAWAVLLISVLVLAVYLTGLARH